MANIIYCEAGGEPYAGQVAVGSVVINRVLSSIYPNTVVGVVYQNKQFSPVASGRLALALANDSATASCYKAADEAMSGVTNVGQCVYFRTPIPGLEGIRIGGHIFIDVIIGEGVVSMYKIAILERDKAYLERLIFFSKNIMEKALRSMQWKVWRS